jgi:hypothetical protein
MVAGSRVATNCGVNTLSVRPATVGGAFSLLSGNFDALILGCHEALRLVALGGGTQRTICRDRGRTSLRGSADEVIE